MGFLMETNTKVSVIIPVYNTAEYLRECIESLCAQTLKGCEFVFVDDGSLDDSVQIISDYAAKDARIKILRQEHQGIGAARNKGMSLAQGEYLMFLDSDDFFELDLLEKAYVRAEETNADVVLFGACRFNNDTKVKEESARYLRMEFLREKKIFSRKDIPDTILSVTTPCTWTKLFRRSFVGRNKLQFQDLSNSEDVYFVIMSLCLSERIAYVDEPLVNYRFGHRSNDNNAEKDPRCCFIAVASLYRELTKMGIFSEIETSFVNFSLSTLTHCINTTRDEEAVKKCTHDLLEEIDLLRYPSATYRVKENYDLLSEMNKRYSWNQYQLAVNREPSFHTIKDSRKNSNPFFSVVVSVFNTEDYVSECVDSILLQPFTDLEIICVDDGSSDNSLPILCKLASADERVVVCSQKNRGPSSARNNGLSVARGKYIMFLDSDDRLEKNALLLLKNRVAADDLDLLLYDGVSFIDDNCNDKRSIEIQHSHLHYYERNEEYSGLYTGPEMIRAMRNNSDHKPNPCMMIAKRDYIFENHLKFYEGIIHEDNLYTFACLLHAKRVSHIKKELYLRRFRKNSIMTQNETFSNVYGYFVCYLEGNKELSLITDSLAEEEVKASRSILANMIRNARSIYRSLSKPEQSVRKELSGSEKEYFSLLISDTVEARDELEEKTIALSRIESNLSNRLQQANQEISKINTKLQQAYKEKSEINAKLQQAYKDKSEINTKLQQAYKEKSEINAKLQQAYKDKSEINAKLKKTYEEKTQRGEMIRKLEKELNVYKSSISYRIWRKMN